MFLYDQNQVESKSHKVSIAGSGSVSGMYRSRSLYKQRWGKSPHNIASHIEIHCSGSLPGRHIGFDHPGRFKSYSSVFLYG